MNVIGDGQALIAFHGALGSVESVRKNEEADLGRYTIRYASLNAVHAECLRACEMHDLQVIQEPTLHEGMFAVFNTLIHKDMSRVELSPMCLPMPKDAQALGSATTYLRRYSLVSQFGLAVEDDDGRAATVAAHTQPGQRTEAERMIRELMGAMSEDERKQFAGAFRDEFRCGLSDLPASRHGQALTWTQEWKARQSPTDAEDAAWTAAAKGET